MEDIEDLIEDSRRLVAEVHQLHSESVGAGQLVRPMRPRIKSLLEHQRSILDYLAGEVSDRYIPRAKRARKVYYPIARKPEDFPERLQANLPNLQATHPEIGAAFERQQPYGPGMEWLGWLGPLVNDNKHRALTKQEQQETEIWRGARGNSVQGISFQVEGQEPTNDPTGFIVGSGPWHKGTTIEWTFSKPPLAVLTTLGLIQGGVERTVADIRQAASL